MNGHHHLLLQETSERKWTVPDNHWLPERSDHPLEGPPTSWGLIERKRSQSQCLQRQRTTPEIRFSPDIFSLSLSFFYILSLVSIPIGMFPIVLKYTPPRDARIFHE